MDKFSDICYKYIKYNNKRSLTIIFSIMISVFLIFGFGTLGFSIYNSYLGQATANGDYVVIFDNLSDKDYELLKEHVNIDEICAIDESSKVTLPQKKSEDRTLAISAYKELNQEVFAYSLDEGNYPENSNEIMIEDVSRYFLDKNYNIGDKITLNTEENKKTYKIVGFFSKADSSNRNKIFSAVTIKDKDRVVSSWKVYADFKSHNNIKESAEKISINLGFKELRLNYNNELISLYGEGDNAMSNITLLLTFCCLLILVSELIIRNTIHMSVVERTKDFGILRCLGISQRKLKKILYKESFLLGVIAVIAGIIITFGMLKIVELITRDKLYMGEYFKIKLYPFIILLSILLVFVAIIFSLFEPNRILKKVSPLEALRSNFAIKKEGLKRRQRGGFIFRKIFGIEGEYAYKNIMRNKGKFISILVAFTISITVFIAFNGVLKSFMEGEVIGNYNYAGYYDATIFMEGGFEEKVSMESSLNEILNIKGVIEAKEDYSNHLPYFDEKYIITEEYKNLSKEGTNINVNMLSSSRIVGYDKKELNLLKENITEGNFDVDNLKDDEVILCNYVFQQNGNDKSKKIKVYNIKVGDEISIIDYLKYRERTTDLYDKNIGKALYDEGLYKKFKVVAIIDRDPIGYISPNIIFSKEGFRKIVPENSARFHSINLKLEGCEISKELNDYILNKPQYESIDYNNQSMFYIKQMENTKLYINIIIIIIGVICALNIMNTIATNQVLRKKEFATLRTIGMSKKRLCKMITLEVIIASIIASIFGIIIGNYIGYNFISRASEGAGNYIIPYSAICLGVVGVIGISLIASFISIIKIGNQNIVEGIKDNE